MFCILSQTCQRKKIWVPMRKQGSDLWIPGSDAPPLSHRDTMVSKAITKFTYDKQHAYCKDQSAMLIASIPHGVSECFHFFLCPTLVTRHRFLCFFTELKIYHLPHSFHHLYVMLFSRLWSGPHIWLPIQGHDADCGDPVVSCTRAPSWLQSTNHSCGYVGCGLYFWWAPWQ